ncbi:helix-turn-helix transcriptional regulator [Bacillus smithii]|uniref:helix-turn-helix domain-containing protein n=1 Tax=Bacillus smithii TaxID=1479 RepID=UPI003D1A847F
MFHPGIRIKELRTKYGLSQDELAKKLNMKRENISHYERGKITNIPSDVLLKLADILKTNTDYLLGRSDDPGMSNNQGEIIKESVDKFYFERDNLSDEDIEYIKDTIELLKMRAARRKKDR